MNAAEKLAALRAELARQGLDGFIVPRADEHLGEYVPEGAERLAWLTGFTGSAGLAAILADRAAVFTDGRYVLQVAAQTDAALWERRHITEVPPRSASRSPRRCARRSRTPRSSPIRRRLRGCSTSVAATCHSRRSRSASRWRTPTRGQ